MPPRPVPLWRLLLAWLALATGIAAFWSAGPYLNTLGGLYAFVGAWFLSSKVASLLCLRSDEFRRLGWLRLIAYLIFPGTQPRHFLPERKPSANDVRPTLLGVVLNFVAGALFLWAVPLLLPEQTPRLARAWVGMIGLAFLVLFVRFDVAVLVFRWLGFGVEKCWHCPVAATSVAEFWGFRWNRIMSGLLRDVLFVPLARRVGATLALLAVFLYSGLLHETPSFTLNAGYGGPTLYFLIQGAGVWLEGRRGFRRVLLRRPWVGRAWTAAFVVGPVALTVQPRFVEAFIVPMLREMNVPGITP